MRQDRGNPTDVRASALWGRGGGSDKRSRMRLGRSAAVLSVVVLASVLAAGASAGSSAKAADGASAGGPAPGGVGQAEQDVQGDRPGPLQYGHLDGRFRRAVDRHCRSPQVPGHLGRLRDAPRQADPSACEGAGHRGDHTRRAGAVDRLPGQRDVAGYRRRELAVDRSAAVACPINPRTGLKVNPFCRPTLAGPAPQAPTIAIVDSGIDATKTADFGNRSWRA